MNCDVHHIVAWKLPGVTDLKNLTLRCRRHHGDNNDAQDFRRNMAHAARCPDTGRAGTQYPRTDGLKFNDSTAAQQSAHHKLKHQDPAEPEHLASRHTLSPLLWEEHLVVRREFAAGEVEQRAHRLNLVKSRPVSSQPPKTSQPPDSRAQPCLGDRGGFAV